MRTAGNPDALLSRELGTRQLAATIFNYTVGSGIFVLPAFAVLQLGTAAPLAYVACAIIIGLVVLCFAEAGSRVSATGGPYAYVETALGPMVGFVAGCLVLATGNFGRRRGVASVAGSLHSVAGAKRACLGDAVVHPAAGQYVGRDQLSRREDRRARDRTVTVAKLLPLLAFVGDRRVLHRARQPGLERRARYERGARHCGRRDLRVLGYRRFADSQRRSEESRRRPCRAPRSSRSAPRRCCISRFSSSRSASWARTWRTTARRRWPAAAGAIAGPTGRTILVVGAVISMFGYLSANVLSEPRGLFAFSRDGFLPTILSSVHPRFHTPHIAIMVYGVVVASHRAVRHV